MQHFRSLLFTHPSSILLLYAIRFPASAAASFSSLSASNYQSCPDGCRNVSFVIENWIRGVSRRRRKTMCLERFLGWRSCLYKLSFRYFFSTPHTPPPPCGLCIDHSSTTQQTSRGGGGGGREDGCVEVHEFSGILIWTRSLAPPLWILIRKRPICPWRVYSLTLYLLTAIRQPLYISFCKCRLFTERYDRLRCSALFLINRKQREKGGEGRGRGGLSLDFDTGNASAL